MDSKIAEKGRIRYKAYSQDLALNVPVALKRLVQENVLLHLIDELIEGLSIGLLEQYYTGHGRPAYHPRLMLKVWLYGYCNKVYTSRPLARKLREDLGFMYLAGGHRPCFKTLSEFRGNRMKGLIDEVFTDLLSYLVQHDYIDLNDLYIDGSKWEANANKHKVVWRKNTVRYKQAVQERIREVLLEIEALQKAEDDTYGHSDLKIHRSAQEIALVLDSAYVSDQVKRLNEIAEREVENKKQAKLIKGQAKALAKEQKKLEKYEEQEQKLGQRNSYSKTDEDATFMRLKDELLRAGYNIQISTSNQYIINPTIHQNGSDSPTLRSHLEQLHQRLEGLVAKDWTPDVTLDAGYGSEENYALLEDQKMEGYMKYPTWYQEHSGQLKKKKYRRENWLYNEQEDWFICPAAKPLHFLEQKQVQSKNGYLRTLRIYEAKHCTGCPHFEACRGPKAKPKTNRRVQISRKLEAYKEKAKALLDTEKGRDKRAQRSIDVETPFGDIKYNMGHKRFYLRGLEKVHIEFSLLAMAHNLRKIHCEQTGIWKQYYAQRAAKKAKKDKKRA